MVRWILWTRSSSSMVSNGNADRVRKKNKIEHEYRDRNRDKLHTSPCVGEWGYARYLDLPLDWRCVCRIILKRIIPQMHSPAKWCLFIYNNPSIRQCENPRMCNEYLRKDIESINCRYIGCTRNFSLQKEWRCLRALLSLHYKYTYARTYILVLCCFFLWIFFSHFYSMYT